MMTLLLTAALFLAPPDANPLRVATFNIRHGAANDGENRWEKRKDVFFATLRKMDSDVIGLQEVLAFQFDEIKAAMPGYEIVGVGRNDGKRDGEFVPVAFKSERFEMLGHGHLWLSETPEQPGSRGWDAQLPRMATWVRLKERGTGRALLFVNTHFDHMGKRARAESAKLVRARIGQWRDGAAVVLVGDFNARQQEEPYGALVDEKPDAVRLLDSFRIAHPQQGKEEGTFHGFTGERSRERIDWILHTPELKTLACEVVYEHEGARYPSDHFPVAAVLEFVDAGRK